LDRFEFIGKLCGAAARFTAFMECEFPSLVWRSLLGETIGWHEVQTVDVKTASYLEAILEIDDDAVWEQRQQEPEPVRWCVRLANGRGLALRGDGTELVSFAEREAYVELAEAKWLGQFIPQLEAMKNGFCSNFPQLAARLLTWRELERRVCGFPDVDVSQLQRIAQYEGSYSKDDPYIADFWQVLRELSGQERKLLLGFVWGRSRLPASPTSPFTIDSSGGSGNDDQLPMSHTCMFQLHLPRYSSPSVLKARLRTAITGAGQKTDRRDGSAERYHDDEMQMDLGAGRAGGEGGASAAVGAAAPSYLLKLPNDGGGHKESLGDFCRRAAGAGVDEQALRQQLKVNSMLELLAQEASAVKAGLGAMGLSKDTITAVQLALAQARARWPPGEDAGQTDRKPSSPSGSPPPGRPGAGLGGGAGGGDRDSPRDASEEIAFLERMLRDDLSDDWGSEPQLLTSLVGGAAPPGW